MHLAGLPAGGYFIAASAPGHAPASAQGGEPIYLAASADRTGVNIALARGGARVRGSVVDATGGPIARARVRALRLTPPRLSLDLESDAQGRFEVWVEPGYIELSAEAEGYARARASVRPHPRSSSCGSYPAAASAGSWCARAHASLRQRSTCALHLPTTRSSPWPRARSAVKTARS